jgi:alkanesulfonate monooxygenase SsuD/methylene tetrahydromethanopterin reductase-like flavin-dependent oxidoreductase (luciferase family)
LRRRAAADTFRVGGSTIARLALRYDLRHPPIAPDSATEQYAAAVEQAAWADRLGFEAVILSEHHGADDDYLPSPIVLASAIAARTRRIRLRLAAVVAPFHDPLRLAEDLAVLDIISDGRLDVTIGAGYAPSEFAMFDRNTSERVAHVEELVAVLQRAWTGEPFIYRGRTVQVRPRPVQRPRPRIDLGGSSEPAARRAARIADGFFPSMPEQWPAYRAEVLARTERDPGACPWPGAEFVHVAERPDEVWPAILPHALHEVNEYGRIAAETGAATGFTPIEDPDVLRATGMYRVITPEECLSLLHELPAGQIFVFHPLMGGLSTDLAWSSLRLLEERVLPHLPR